MIQEFATNTLRLILPLLLRLATIDFLGLTICVVLSKFFLVSMMCGAMRSLKTARNETMTGHSAPSQTTDSKQS